MIKQILAPASHALPDSDVLRLSVRTHPYIVNWFPGLLPPDLCFACMRL